jgi:hypothetical protein
MYASRLELELRAILFGDLPDNDFDLAEKLSGQ